MVHLFILYPQDARVILCHHEAVIPYVPTVWVLLVPQTYVLSGSNKISLPQGFRQQAGLDEFLHLACDVGVHLPGIFQKPFHVVVDVVPCNAHHDLRNSLRLDEVFPAYSTHVGDDTRGQKRGKRVGVALVYSHLCDVLGGATPRRFHSIKVTQKAFLFIDVDLKLSNVVRQGIRVQN